MSNAFYPFVLFVSFVVKQFCTSARVLALGPLSLGAHSKRRRGSFLDPFRDSVPLLL
jgi:hypothetical protein